jgi:hypothetical protein
MNTSERKRLHPLPNAPKNTNPQPNTTQNTTKEVVPKQLATSTQKEKINQHKPPIAAIAIATIIVYPLWRSRRIHNHRN